MKLGFLQTKAKGDSRTVQDDEERQRRTTNTVVPEKRPTEHSSASEGTDRNTVGDASALKLTLLTVGLCFAVFCQALDNTIIATAIPRITNEFRSLDDVGWYGSAYLLTTCAFQLSYGRLYNFFSIKWVFLTSLGIFELGSLVCGAAPTSVGLIMGRAVAGIGSGGIYSGAVLIVANAVPLAKRPIFNGIFGGMYAIASVAGPLLGGAFTEYVTWRLCFYINLPFGVITAAAVLYLLRDMKPPPRACLPLSAKLRQLDPLGLLAFLPTVICLLLAIQWGGSRYAWKSVPIIALFIVTGLCFLAFVALQLRQGDGAMVPPSIARQRTIWTCSFFCFFLFGSFLAITYYLPVWFQAIKGVSATKSGINNLPAILGTVVFTMVSGGMVTVLGYYTWACISASILASVGAGLLSTLSPTTPSGRWIGYQIIYGAGVGLGLQIPLIALQAVLPEHQISEGIAIIIFIQTLGGSIFISVAQNVFNIKLLSNVRAADIPIDFGNILSQGATDLARLVPPGSLLTLRDAYNRAITESFYVAVATAALSAFGSVLIPWLSVKKVQAERDEKVKQRSGSFSGRRSGDQQATTEEREKD